MIVRDPCGNPLPIPIDLPAYAVPSFTIPSLADLLKLLGIELPTVDATIPCPILIDRARAAAATP